MCSLGGLEVDRKVNKSEEGSLHYNLEEGFQRGARKWLTLTNFNPENYTNTNSQIQIKNTNTNLKRENSI